MEFESVVADVKSAAHNERRQRFENSPYAEADLRLSLLLFPAGHPYHGGIIGTHEDIDRMSAADARRFFEDNYRPSNLTLVVAGDFEPATAQRLIAKYFGSLRAPTTRPAAPALGGIQKPPERRLHEVLVRDAAIPRLTFGWVLPPAYSGPASEAHVLSRLLGAGKWSILARLKVRDKGVVREATCTLSDRRLGSLLQCDLLIDPQAPILEVEQAVDRSILELATQGPSAADLRRAQLSARAEIFRRLERLRDRTDLLAEAHYLGGDTSALDRLVAGIDASTKASVQRVTAQWLSRAHEAVVVVLPKGAQP